MMGLKSKIAAGVLLAYSAFSATDERTNVSHTLEAGVAHVSGKPILKNLSVADRIDNEYRLWNHQEDIPLNEGGDEYLKTAEGCRDDFHQQFAKHLNSMVGEMDIVTGLGEGDDSSHREVAALFDDKYGDEFIEKFNRLNLPAEIYCDLNLRRLVTSISVLDFGEQELSGFFEHRAALIALNANREIYTLDPRDVLDHETLHSLQSEMARGMLVEGFTELARTLMTEKHMSGAYSYLTSKAYLVYLMLGSEVFRSFFRVPNEGEQYNINNFVTDMYAHYEGVNMSPDVVEAFIKYQEGALGIGEYLDAVKDWDSNSYKLFIEDFKHIEVNYVNFTWVLQIAIDLYKANKISQTDFSDLLQKVKSVPYNKDEKFHRDATGPLIEFAEKLLKNQLLDPSVLKTRSHSKSDPALRNFFIEDSQLTSYTLYNVILPILLAGGVLASSRRRRRS